jgi:hypothetical protein
LKKFDEKFWNALAPVGFTAYEPMAIDKTRSIAGQTFTPPIDRPPRCVMGGNPPHEAGSDQIRCSCPQTVDWSFVMARMFSIPRKAVLAIATLSLLSLLVPGSGQAAEFSDSQIKSYVTAWTSINQLAEQLKPRVEAATTEGQKAEMFKQFNIQMIQLIEQTEGIGPDEYANIMEAAQSDPELSERIFAMLQAVQPN